MSDLGRGVPPPPGWQPPTSPPPGWPGWQAPSPLPPAPPGWQPPPGMLGAAHKPGAVPLRPLTLGDIYDAAFRIIRFNPKATVGSAVLVAAVAMVIPVLITAVLTATVNLSFDGGDFDGQALFATIGTVVSLGLGVMLAGFGAILVTAMISHVTAAAAVGHRLTLGQAWAATHGKRWRLVGLALLLAAMALALLTAYAVAWVVLVVGFGDRTGLLVVWGVLSVPAFFALMLWFWVRIYYLPVPALMLEDVGILGAIARGFALTRKQFWRTFGIALLTFIVVAIASNVLSLPIGVVGQVATAAVGSQYALLALVVTQAVSQVVSAAFVTPFTAAVTSVQYLDQRMRKEAFDVELMQRAGITAP